MSLNWMWALREMHVPFELLPCVRQITAVRLLSFNSKYDHFSEVQCVPKSYALLAACVKR